MSLCLKVIGYTWCCNEVTMSIKHQWKTLCPPSLWKWIKPESKRLLLYLTSRQGKFLMELWPLQFDTYYFYHLHLPLWDSWVVKAEFLISVGKPLHVLPVFAPLKHLISFLHVERTAHAAVCGKQCENTWTVERHTFPGAPLDHSLKQNVLLHERIFFKCNSELKFTIFIIALACYIHYIKAWYLRVPEQLKECFVAVFHVHFGVGFPVNQVTYHTITLLTS